MNTQEYTDIQNLIQEYFLNTNENIVGVGYSYKIVNDQKTDKLSIQFAVSKKKDKSELSSSELLPAYLNINNNIYLVDVIEQQLLVNTHSNNHRNLHCPIIGGISIGKPHQTNAGTLGTICIDQIDNTIIGLTNNHVVVDNGFLNSSRPYGAAKANIKYINTNVSNILQPGNIDNTTNHRIGPVKRYYPFNINSLNYIDAAIIAITRPEIIDPKISCKQLNNPINYTPKFASTEEINSLLSNPVQKIYKSARTTGFLGSDSRELEIISILQTLDINGYLPYNTSLTFSDCIIYKFKNNDINGRPLGGVSLPGDSGSVILADFNGYQKIIGLNFAGGSFKNGDPEGNAGVACRIDRVSSLLKISDLPETFSFKFSNPELWTYYENNSDDYAGSCVTKNNDIEYWQIGTI